MDYKSRYKEWKEKLEDKTLSEELSAIASNDTEIRERFAVEMAFGTAGIRGKMGVGTARMNVYTVRRATQGLANHIIKCYGGGSVAVSYDTRNNSPLFARVSAEVLAANGIEVHIYPDAEPTPMLSFAVRKLGCRMGIMITASHNPAEYNGYKVFGADGCQITENDAEMILSCINALDYFDDVKHEPIDLESPPKGVHIISPRLTEDYYKAVLATSTDVKESLLSKLDVAYTPLHGTGYKHVVELLGRIGVGNLSIVPEQREPDGNFTTCEYPNPETKAALKLGVELMLEKGCDILLATDPDADRVGVAVRRGDSARILTGNEVGILLLDFIIKRRSENKTLPERPVAVRSLVSTAMADKIAEKSGVECRKVLTGFKFIGEQIYKLEQNNEQNRFIFGFEESCGYLAGDYVRDKDAQCAAVLLAELAACCKKNKETLCDRLEKLYGEFGYYKSRTLSFEFEGLSGAKAMQDKMESLRVSPPQQLANRVVTAVSDYASRRWRSLTLNVSRPIDLSTSDILEWELLGGASVIVRPSGTEPKIKVYLMVCEQSEQESDKMLSELEAEVSGIIK